MNLKYKILWFEDDEDVINEDVGPTIRSFLLEQGFVLNVIHRLNGEDLNNLIKDKTYDLIITDLNLGEYETGDVLIDHIRNGNIYTEVLLYSANANEINRIVEEKGWIERASFCVGIGNLTSKLRNIISLTIKKNQDVNNTRGLVIAETIDLEKKIEMILLQFFEAAEEQVSSEIKQTLRNSILENKVESHQKSGNSIEKIKISEIRELIDEDILTASNVYESLVGIINIRLKPLNASLNSRGMSKEDRQVLSEKINGIKKLKTEFLNFKNEIIDIRNILAHVEEQIDEEGTPYLRSLKRGAEPIRFNSAKYIEIRKNLQKHSKNLDEILNNIM